MKKLLFTLLFCLLPVIASAKTAIVEYSFPELQSYSVIVWVSEMPNLDTQTTLFGATDPEEDGTVEIGNLAPGKTYYFRARAYEKTTGVATGWSDEIAKLIPAEIIPVPMNLPELQERVFPGFVIDSIVIKPVGQ